MNYSGFQDRCGRSSGCFPRQIRPAPLPCEGALFSRGADYSTRGGLCQPKKRGPPRKNWPFLHLTTAQFAQFELAYRAVGDRVIPKRGGRFPAAPIGPSRLYRRRAGAETVLGGRDGVARRALVSHRDAYAVITTFILRPFVDSVKRARGGVGARGESVGFSGGGASGLAATRRRVACPRARCARPSPRSGCPPGTRFRHGP